MKQSESIKLFDKLNKVINGSKTIVDTIDSDSKINQNKAIKASMLNSISIAETLKEILKDIAVDDFKSKKPDKDFGDIFGDMFGKK